MLDQISIDERYVLLVDFPEGAALSSLSGEKGGLYAEILHAKLLYKTGNPQTPQSPTVTAVTAKLR